MDQKSSMMGDSSGINWDDPMFNSTPFDDSMTAEFNDFTNLYVDSPGFTKPARDVVGSSNITRNPHPNMYLPLSASTEGSSQDSGSDSSSRRKRNVTTESPISDTATEQPSMPDRKEEMMTAAGRTMQNKQHLDQNFTQPMHELSLEHEDSMNPQFGFNSSASSPVQHREFGSALSLGAQVNLPASTMGTAYQQSPVQTVNPGMFQIGPREESPVANNMVFNSASPTAIFSTPSSDSNDAFASNASATWSNGLGQNPTWSGNFNVQYGQAEGFALTPSPMGNDTTPTASRRLPTEQAMGRSPLHIAPISTKSRVETQINIVMTLEKSYPGIEYLHLPLHTIAKSKLLAKEQHEKKKALELHAMLVCTSAMNNPRLKEKALRNAAAQDNLEIQRRAERLREVADEDKNNMADVDEADKPSNGGEVRICSNCIQRERKRAGRKKLKKEEEQQHWERFETERVVVFNSNEYLPFKPYESGHANTRDNASADDVGYVPPEGALQVNAAMRIACYCRHQSEKEGFRVIFTLKDYRNNVVAQQMSDSILITDDHKTHPPNFSTAMPGEIFYQNPSFQPNGLPTSYSMVDLSAQVHNFPSSRSTGNLQAMGYGQQHYSGHSHIHQMPGGGYASQTTSATMTPTSLSRPASPTSAGQTGPNKKRKSSSFHRRVPSGLTMTPRVDTAQTSASGGSNPMPINATSFSPSSAGGYNGQGESSFMAIPNGSAQAGFYGSGPSTPANESTQFFTQAQFDMARAQNASAYFSHPSSAVPSRANSPVLQNTRPNMAQYARQPIQTPTNSIQGRQAVYGGQIAPVSSAGDQDRSSPPTITKITPSEGPVSGGTEVSIYGYNFTNGTQVMFGEQLATTVFYGPQALLATAPPSRPGGVNVTLVPPAGSTSSIQFANPTTSRQVFTYTDTNPRMMEMALRFLSQQQTGIQMPWNQFTNQVATKFMQSSISSSNVRGPSYDGSNIMKLNHSITEDIVLHIFDLADLSKSSDAPQYDMIYESGATLLSLACTNGTHRVTAALLLRGADPDFRDMLGYTPLIYSPPHAHVIISQLWGLKGADPAPRSLDGVNAFDLAPTELRDGCSRIFQNTSRSRLDRPILFSCRSFGSSMPSATSWNISGACFYYPEAETTSRGKPISEPNSRRSSLLSIARQSPRLSPSAMLVWEDGVAAQIQQFQQCVHPHLPQSQLPILPPLSDYQDIAMIGRLGSLVTGRHATSMSNSTWQDPLATPPPAYDDLFPDRATKHDCSKLRHHVQHSVVDTKSDIKSSHTLSCKTTQRGFGVFRKHILISAVKKEIFKIQKMLPTILRFDMLILFSSFLSLILAFAIHLSTSHPFSASSTPALRSVPILETSLELSIHQSLQRDHDT